MNFLTTGDHTRLFVKDWGAGRPFVLLHGWPLSSDTWDDQAMAIANAGYRTIACDRRGQDRADSRGRASNRCGHRELDAGGVRRRAARLVRYSQAAAEQRPVELHPERRVNIHLQPTAEQSAIWSFTDVHLAKVEHLFATAVLAVAASPIDIREHGHLEGI